MTAVHDVLEALEQFAPASMKYDWDNVGLLCGRGSQEVHKILVALDPFEDVCQEAAETGADLIVTHHPLIFQAPKSITDGDSVGRCILFLASHNISAVNAHTNLDCAPGGVNDRLAELLGLQNVEILNPMGTDGQGRPYGLIRMGTVEETPLADFLDRVKENLRAPGLRYADGGKPVRRIAVGGGACAGAVREVYDAGCDTFVTADVKYNQFWDAHDLGLNLIDAGHFWTENPVCAVLAAHLRAAFPEIPVEISKNHTDCMKFL